LRQTIPLPLQPLRFQAPAQPKKPLSQRENQPIAAKNVSPNVAERIIRTAPLAFFHVDITMCSKFSANC
jgi:hypothetical protein